MRRRGSSLEPGRPSGLVRHFGVVSVGLSLSFCVPGRHLKKGGRLPPPLPTLGSHTGVTTKRRVGFPLLSFPLQGGHWDSGERRLHGPTLFFCLFVLFCFVLFCFLFLFLFLINTFGGMGWEQVGEERVLKSGPSVGYMGGGWLGVGVGWGWGAGCGRCCGGLGWWDGIWCSGGWREGIGYRGVGVVGRFFLWLGFLWFSSSSFLRSVSTFLWKTEGIFSGDGVLSLNSFGVN